MSLLFLFTSILLLCYSLMFLWVGHHNYHKTSLHQTRTIETEQKKFTVLVPFRNEAENMRDLINSLNEIKFSEKRFEVLFIDDHSQDNGLKILEKYKETVKFSMRIIPLEKPEEYGKKQAIKRGIEQAKYPWIVTLDADSIVSRDWLISIEEILGKTSAEFVTGPVFFRQQKGLLFQLQTTELMALQALTRASYSLRPLMSNGTNLVYSKRIFNAVSGFSGNLSISSGDDMFLMRKIWRHKKWALAYNNDWSGAVCTKASDSWRAYAAQQLRWMSKTSALKDPLLWLVAFIVFGTNTALVACCLISLGSALVAHANAAQFMLLTTLIFGGKFMVDHICLWLSYSKSSQNTSRPLSKINWSIQILAALTYPFWTLGLTLLSLGYRPRWKGRKIEV